MKTLYEVLNVRADDGAESVREAFRKAVKAKHPDLNGGDPDVQSQFAQIIRANAILRDPELRAIYDRMLEFEQQRCRPRSKFVAIFNTAYSITANAIIGFVLALVLAGGGHKLFTYLSKTSDVTARESVTVAAVPPLAPVDAAGQLKLVGLSKSSAAALGAPVDVAADVKTAVDAAPERSKAAAAPPPLHAIIAGFATPLEAPVDVAADVKMTVDAAPPPLRRIINPYHPYIRKSSAAGEPRDELQDADTVASNSQAPTANRDVAGDVKMTVDAAPPPLRRIINPYHPYIRKSSAGSEPRDELQDADTVASNGQAPTANRDVAGDVKTAVDAAPPPLRRIINPYIRKSSAAGEPRGGLEVDSAGHIKAVGLPKPSAAALGAPVDVGAGAEGQGAYSHRRARYGAEHRRRTKLQRHRRGL